MSDLKTKISAAAEKFTENNLESRYTKMYAFEGGANFALGEVRELLRDVSDNLRAILSAKKSGCVEYKGCECWHQNAHFALKKIDDSGVLTDEMGEK